MSDLEHLDDRTFKMEVNLDDMPGEWLGFVMEKLFDAGARDVFYVPIFMKKNRPGVLLQLLCDEERVDTIKGILFRETTTLGIRYYPLTVHRLERKYEKVNTDWGQVTVKVGLFQGTVMQKAPEYEECKQIAEQFHVPIKKVYYQVWKRIGEE